MNELTGSAPAGRGVGRVQCTLKPWTVTSDPPLPEGYLQCGSAGQSPLSAKRTSLLVRGYLKNIATRIDTDGKSLDCAQAGLTGQSRYKPKPIACTMPTQCRVASLQPTSTRRRPLTSLPLRERNTPLWLLSLLTSVRSAPGVRSRRSLKKNDVAYCWIVLRVNFPDASESECKWISKPPRSGSQLRRR